MPRLIELARPVKPGKLTAIIRINGVSVFVHWSVFVITGMLLLGVIRRPWMTLVGILCYLSMLLIHECGHMIAAQRKGCEVYSIQLYPIFGRCCFQVPWSRFDHCVIAWAGVLAQALVALPLLLWVAIFGYTRFEPINAVFAILGGISLVIAVLNLIPVPPLDGSIAWGLIPEWFKRVRTRAKRPPKRRSDWRTY